MNPAARPIIDAFPLPKWRSFRRPCRSLLIQLIIEGFLFLLLSKDREELEAVGVFNPKDEKLVGSELERVLEVFDGEEDRERSERTG